MQLARDIATAVHGAGGRAFIVGGWVRDRLRGVTSKDIDIEVELTDRVSNAFFLTAKVTCQGELAARLECTCMITPVPTE